MKYHQIARIVVAGLLWGYFLEAGIAYAKPHGHVHLSSSAQKERPAIMRALKSELNKRTEDHVRVVSFTVSKLDVKANYALADVNPSRPAGLDSVFVLMNKKSGLWKVLTLGTNMKGAGREYGVPHKLWAKWGL